MKEMVTIFTMKVRKANLFALILVLLASLSSCSIAKMFGYVEPSAPELAFASTSGISFGKVIATGTQVTIDISESSDPNGDVFGVDWDFDPPNGSSASLDAGANSGTYITFTPDISGAYSLDITLSDGKKENSYSIDLYADTLPPNNVESAWALADGTDEIGTYDLTGTFSGTTDRFGTANAALASNTGTSLTATISAGDFSLAKNSSDFTFGAWIQIDTTLDPGNDYLVASSDGGLWSLGYDSASGNFGFSYNSSMEVSFADYSDLEIGTWYHFAVTYDSSEDLLTLYFNGEQSDSSESISPSLSAGGSFYLSSDGTINGLDGAIDEVVIFDELLSKTEIQLMGAGY